MSISESELINSSLSQTSSTFASHSSMRTYYTAQPLLPFTLKTSTNSDNIASKNLQQFENDQNDLTANNDIIKLQQVLFVPFYFSIF